MEKMLKGTESLKQTLHGWQNNATQQYMFDDSALTVTPGFTFDREGLISYFKAYFKNYKKEHNNEDATEIDASKFNVQRIKEMNSLFSGAAIPGFSKVKQIKGLDTWDVSNVTNMAYMFAKTGSLDSLDLSNWNTAQVQVFDNMFNGTGAKDINLTGWDLSNAFNVTDMFYDLQNPAVITLDNATLLSTNTKFQVSDFGGKQPIVVFYNGLDSNPDFANLNQKHWRNKGQDVTGRQNSDYLTIKDGTQTTTIPVDFIYKDQAALDAALAQKLSGYSNIALNDSRVGDDAAKALQDVTGNYEIKSEISDQPDKPNKPVDPGKPDKPTDPTTPTDPDDKPDTPDDPDQDDTPDKPAYPKKQADKDHTDSKLHNSESRGTARHAAIANG